MSNQDNHSSNHSSHFDTSTHDLMPSAISHGNLNELKEEMNNFNLEMRKSRMPLTSNARRDETTILLSIMSKYNFNQANNNKSLQVKKWTEVLDTFNKLNTQGNFCKQTRTLKSRYEKLVAIFLQNDLKTLKRLMHEKDIPLLQDIINTNNNNNSHNNIDFNREMNSRPVKRKKTKNKKEINNNIEETNKNKEETNKNKEHYGDNDEEEDEDLPLDSITVLPRSSYLSKREADAQAAASTESASPTTTNTSYSYISPNNNNSNNKRLSLLYGAAMMEEENHNIHASPMSNSTNSTTRLYNASRDLEIQQLRESIVDIKNNILNLEKIFDRLNKKVDDLVKNDETFKDRT